MTTTKVQTRTKRVFTKAQLLASLEEKGVKVSDEMKDWSADKVSKTVKAVKEESTPGTQFRGEY